MSYDSISDKEARRRSVDAKKAQVWTRYIRAGLEAKKAWTDSAREVMGYFNTTHDDFFRNSLSNYMNLHDKGICVSVNRAALVRAVVCPHLYQKAPKREVNTTRADGPSIALAHLLECLLNYTVNETSFTRSVYRMIDDAELRGLGALRTGWDPTYKVCTSWWISSERIVVDPAATTMDDARWIAVSTRMPLDEIMDEYGGKTQSWRVDGLKGLTGKESVEADSTALSGYLRDQLSVWDVYSKMGTGLRRGPEAMEDNPYRDDNDDKKFVKFSIVLDHQQCLAEEEWEVPLYLDKRWPITPLQFVESLDRFWAPSPMQQAMVHQKNMDVFASLLTAQARVAARNVTFVKSGLIPPAGIEQIVKGGPEEVVELGDMPPGMKPGDALHQMPLGRIDPGIMTALQWHTEQFDLVTGATPVLQGGQDQGATERSATASQQKSAAANVRLMDQRSRVEDALAQAARNEAIAWRLGDLAEPDDVARIVGDLDLGWRIDLPVSIPLRGEGWSLEALYSPAATYFPSARDPMTGEPIKPPTPDPSMASLVEPIWVAIQQLGIKPGSPQEAQAALLALAMDSPPGAMVPPGIQPRKVTPEDVFVDTAGLSPEDVVREFQFTVVSGSTQKQDPDAKRERAQSLEQNALPAALKMGAFEVVDAIFDRADDAFGVPPDERLPPFRPPMPPPQAAPQGQGGPPEGMGGPPPMQGGT